MSSIRHVQVNGVKLKQIRELLCWSQEMAGKRSGYSARLIRKLEMGGPVKRSTFVDVLAAYDEGRLELNVGPHAALNPNDFLLQNRDSVAVVLDWFERVFNQRDLTAIDELVADDVVLLAEGDFLSGRQQIRARIEAILSGFNPLAHTVEDIVNDGSKIVVYWNVRATHSGFFFGIHPTQREVFIRGSTMAVIRDGLFIEARDHWDARELISQIS